MMNPANLRLMVYQHVVQLTVAGEYVSRAMMIAYDVARIVTDDDFHGRCMDAALKRMQLRAATRPVDAAEPAKARKSAPGAALETVDLAGGSPAATPRDKRPKS